MARERPHGDVVSSRNRHAPLLGEIGRNWPSAALDFCVGKDHVFGEKRISATYFPMRLSGRNLRNYERRVSPIGNIPKCPTKTPTSERYIPPILRHFEETERQPP